MKRYIPLLVVVLLITHILAYVGGKHKVLNSIESYSDTTTITKVVYDIHPMPTATVSSVNMPFVFFLRDSVYVPEYSGSQDSIVVELPFETKYYKRDKYEAWVFGYKPELIQVNVFDTTRVIETVKWIEPKVNNWNLFATTSFNYCYEPSLNLGLGLSYTKNKFDVSLSAGYQSSLKQYSPFVEFKFKYSIFEW